MLSVLTQTAFQNQNFSLLYNVVDGGSADKTVEIVERVIAKYVDVKNLQINFISEKDTGMYDALAKGFAIEACGDVYSYINAGDYYSKYAFDIVSDIFIKNKVHFLTGLNALYNEESHLINLVMPFCYNKKLLIKGFYGKVLPFIQQESTFWSHKLHCEINFEELKKLKLAGDYFLWKTFIEIENLYIVSAWLGGFKIHHGQLSSRCVYEYRKEQDAISIKPTLLDYIFAYIHKFVWLSPDFVKKRLCNDIFEYDHERHEYHVETHFIERLFRRIIR